MMTTNQRWKDKWKRPGRGGGKGADDAGLAFAFCVVDIVVVNLFSLEDYFVDYLVLPGFTEFFGFHWVLLGFSGSN